MAKAVVNYLAGNPLVSADGLNILCRKVPDAGRPVTYANDEEIVAWNDHYGYTDHDNDGMTTKGFLYYHVAIGPYNHPCDLDVYVLHADAGSGWKDGDEGDIAAHEKQMAQLFEHIRQKVSTRPLLIMGDFNCYYTRDRLKELFIDRIETLAHSVRDVQLQRARPRDVAAEAQRVQGKQTGF